MAWKNLREYYESHGSIDQYVADCTNELYKIKLDWNSQSGFERYVSDFETICLRLEEAKNPLTEIQKKMRFLSGIHDKDYNEIVTICRHDDKLDFEATVRKDRSEAKAKGKLKANKQTRQVNNTTNANATKNKRNGKGNKRKKGSKNRKANNAGTSHEGQGSQENTGNNLGLPKEVWAKMNKEQKKLYLQARNGARNQDSQGYGKQYTKQVNQVQNGTGTDTGNDDETVASGNIWRTTPTKRASMMRRVNPPKGSDDEEGVY
jgi:hypothetical protein